MEETVEPLSGLERLAIGAILVVPGAATVSGMISDLTAPEEFECGVGTLCGLAFDASKVLFGYCLLVAGNNVYQDIVGVLKYL